MQGYGILITDVATGNKHFYQTPDGFSFDGTYNVSHDWLYLEEYGIGETGGVYLVSLADYGWKGRWGKRIYEWWGVMLLDGEPAEKYIRDLWVISW